MSGFATSPEYTAILAKYEYERDQGSNTMPSPDNLELEAAKERITTLTTEIDRLRRRVHMLEVLLGDMLDERIKNPPRRRRTKE